MFRMLAAGAAALLCATAAAEAQTPVKIGVFGIIAEAGLYVAQEKGYFKEEGLGVEFLTGMVGPDAFPALATGRIDAVGGSFGPANINAVKRGIKVRLVAGLSSYRKGWDSGFYLVRKDLIDSGKVKDWKDLRGLTLAVSAGRPNLGDYITLQVLKKGGMTSLEDAKVVEMPFTNIISALKSGGIDAAHTAEPQSTLAVGQQAAVKWHAASEYLPEGMTVAILQYGPSLLEQNPGVGEKLMLAMLRGARDYNKAFGPGGQGRSEVIQHLIKHTQVKNPALYSSMGMSYIEPEGALNVAVLNDQAAFYNQRGATDPIDVATITDDRFAKAAVAKLGAYRP
jgi:NitT/TauT family transport system substrate-binding protein